MRTVDRIWALGLAGMTLIVGLPGCGAGSSPTGTPTTTTTPAPVGTPTPPPPPLHVGIWLEATALTGLWPQQRKGPCIVTDIAPTLGAFRVGAAPTSIRWTIYNKCPGTQVVRIAFKGPTNPFLSCPGLPQIAAGLPFQIQSGVPAVDTTCTLVSGPCTHFGVDVNSFPLRLPPPSCLTASGQIEIEPW